VVCGRLCPNKTKVHGGQIFLLVAMGDVKISMFSLLVTAPHVISSITKQPYEPTETLVSFLASQRNVQNLLRHLLMSVQL
jgi:hypothetical protein